MASNDHTGDLRPLALVNSPTPTGKRSQAGKRWLGQLCVSDGGGNHGAYLRKGTNRLHLMSVPLNPLSLSSGAGHRRIWLLLAWNPALPPDGRYEVYPTRRRRDGRAFGCVLSNLELSITGPA